MRIIGFVLTGIVAAFAATPAAASPQQDALRRQVELTSPAAFGRMLDDWQATWGDSADLAAARAFARGLPAKREAALKAAKGGDSAAARAYLAEVRRHVLAQPLVKGMEVLAVRRNYNGERARHENSPGIATMACYNTIDFTDRNVDSSIVRLSGLDAEKVVETPVYVPPRKGTICSMDLNFDGKRILYIARGSQDRWRLFEVNVDGTGARQIIPDSFGWDLGDCCYLPAENQYIVTSDAAEQGLPCESGRLRMTNSYRYDGDTGKMRRLTFDQDSNWYPSVLEDGRVLYVRWEYCDISHFFSRIVMTMHPDGTRQMGYFGSNGFWPNHYGNPLQIPGTSGKFVCVVTGHHTGKPGQLCLFDASRGRAEAAGAVQMIPGWQQPIPEKVEDHLYGGLWPKYLQPFPLGTSPKKDGAGKYFLVSMKPTPGGLWGLYLVDVFDNVTLLQEGDGRAYNEPIRLAARKRPPVIPDRVDTSKDTCTIHIADVYKGPGTEAVPRGTIKSVRVFAYHYAFNKTGSHEGVGTESSWDMKYVLGTVPVDKLGGVFFTAPANLPVSLQPLDKDGAAVQLMRSWTVGQPGEATACIGCHESANSILNVPVLNRAPDAITPPGGKVRAWSFMREIQPILDRRCAGCHDKDPDPAVAAKKPNAQGVVWFEPGAEQRPFQDCRKPNLADITPVVLRYRLPENNGIQNSGAGAFSKSYQYLNPYVRRPGPESDNHLFNPMEYNANTSPLVQMLRKGHHGVVLDPDEWRALYTWIDLNAPFWGDWTDFSIWWSNESHRNWIGIHGSDQQLARMKESRQRREDGMRRFQGWDPSKRFDPETDTYDFAAAKKDLAAVRFVKPAAAAPAAAVAAPAGWPFAAPAAGAPVTLDIPGGKLAFRPVPAGSFVMGDAKGAPDEAPHVVTIAKKFYMAEIELSNGQYLQFAPLHYNGYVDMLSKDHTSPGLSMMSADMPVVRVSREEARAYCAWLSAKLGKKVRLPTEAEWEWAARAGTATPFFWGADENGFAKCANLADRSLDNFPSQRQTYNYHLRDMDVDDGAMIPEPAAKERPGNPFGLRNMIGNVAEWTDGGYGTGEYPDDAVARGGAFDSLPRFARASFRTPYHPWQRVYNVGIRLVLEE